MTEPILTAGIAATPKPDIAATSLYPLLARISLFELHANLLELLGKGVAGIEGHRNIVVVGPGSEALPFSEHLETVIGLVNGGNLILLDYNQQICDRLPSYLESKGFSQRFNIVRCGDENLIDPGNRGNTIMIKEWDIRNGLPLPGGSVDAIDMTVALHHITQYASDIDKLFKQAGEVLKEGGILHVGEGNVDMKYSERKIRRLAHDLCSFGTGGVVVIDDRQGDTAPRQWHAGERSGGARMHISPRGMVAIEHGDGEILAEFLSKAGYKQLYATGRMVVLPLIDHAMEEDFQEMIVPVRNFYASITGLCLRRLGPEFHDEFFRVVHKEQSDAERGIVEYYSLPAMLCDSLVAAGFIVEELRYTANGPWANILAKKRSTAP